MTFERPSEFDEADGLFNALGIQSAIVEASDDDDDEEAIKHCMVFDVDGTLANIGHRLHHIRGTGPKDWKSFKVDSHLDLPHGEVVAVFSALAAVGWPIVLCTGRTEDERGATEKWLDEFVIDFAPAHKMYMRADGDYRDDDVVKLEMLARLRSDGYEPVVWFDDRQRVVDALRGAGVNVFQVRPGAF